MDRAPKTLLSNLVYPALLATGYAVHAFTSIVAYQLVGPGTLKYFAAVVAWLVPGIAELVVAYYAWRESGSMVNAYSVWVLVWLVMVLGVVLVASEVNRSAQRETGQTEV